MLKLCLQFMALFTSLHMQAAMAVDVVGEAYDVGGKQLLYREYHYYNSEGMTARVDYQSPVGNVFATKTIDYESGFSQPSFEQTNSLNGRILSAHWQDKKLTLKAREKLGAVLQEKTLDYESPLVIDAGFDNFLKRRWSVLMEGERIKINYAVPAMLAVYNLALKKKECSYQAREGEVCFVITAANRLLSLFIEPIELGYDVRSKQLLRFRGASNIADEQGDTYKVDIRFRHSVNVNGLAQS